MARRALTFTFVALLAASTTVVLEAQQVQGGAVVNLPPQPIPPSQGLSINRPLGSEITGVKTNPPPGFGPTRTPFDARPGTYTRLHRGRSYGVPYGYGYGYAAPFYADPSAAPESTYEKLYRRSEPPITTGTLFLDVTPATALVFVDTAYVGSVGDLQTRGVTLSAGRHYVNLESSGYDTRTIEVTITAGEPLRYRYDMTPTRRAEAVVTPPRVPQTMYAIPGCYGGNKPPVAARLPKGCDIAKLRVIRPQTRTN